VNRPKLSVIIPVYNVEEFLKETIDSFLDDDFEDFEIVAIDDCSTDGSLKILEDYAKKDERVKVHKNKENLGKKTTVNNAFDSAIGENIALFDSDDINIPGRLSEQIKFLEENKDIDMVYGDILVYYMKDSSKIPQDAIEFENVNQPLERLKLLSSDKETPSKIEKASQILHPKKYIPASSAIFRRKIIDDGIHMDENLRNIEDLDFWLQIIGAGYKIRHISIETYVYRIHPGQKSRDSTKKNIARDVIVKKLMEGKYFR
jgi:glycosyltransferase involved in cell wall biosynthesis